MGAFGFAPAQGLQTGGGGGAPVDAKYIVQTPDGTLTDEQALSALATGILKSTTGTGVVSIAVAGTDYYNPGGTDVAVADGGTGASTAATARANLGASPLDPQFLALATNAELTNERVFTPGFGLTATDAGAGGAYTVKSLYRRTYYADQFENPITSDWAVNALAPAAAGSINNGLTLRQFDDTTEEGIGFTENIPTGATNIKLYFKSRAQTAPGAARTVGLKLYFRTIPNNSAVSSWSAGTVLTDIDIPTNTLFQYDDQTIALSTLSLTAGNTVQFELTRIDPSAGTELVGDWNLLELIVEFS